MALLSVEHRKAVFKYLGLGEYNEQNIKAFQKKYLLRKSDVDGIYGSDTDNALRTVYYTKRYCKDFRPEEFRCECHGKYCCGYPNFMKPSELIHIQAIRDHYGKPITVTCGLRCRTWNSHLGGSIQNSLHMQGQAIDFYQEGVTDNLANRKRSIKWIKKQPSHHYTYGNGINSYGNYVNAPYMGNALHTDTYNKVKATYPKYEESLSTGVSEPHKTASEAEKKSADEIAKEVLDGKWGVGAERVEKLKKAGYDPVEIQKKVNALKPTEKKPTKKLNNREKIAKKGYKFAWHTKKGKENAPYPKGHAKKAYNAALDKYFGKKRRWQKSARLGASCDVFVATCIRAAGVDRHAPRGLGRSYFDKSDKFKRVKVTSETIKNGDIISIEWKNGNPHWCIAYDGKILEASLKGWYPKVTNTLKSRLSPKGKRSVVVYRAV